MTRRIGFADIRLDFHDAAYPLIILGHAYEQLAEEILRHLDRVPVVERARQLMHAGPAPSAA